MAEITRIGPFRHLRADATSHVLHYQGEKLRRSARGAAFWFTPWDASLAELPADDRELSLLLRGRSADFQDVVIQGVLTYRISNPERTAQRVDFSIDPATGKWLRQPLEKITLFLTQLAHQHALVYVQANALREILGPGLEAVRGLIEQQLATTGLLEEMGLTIVSVRITSVKPSTDLERALEAPTRERIQEEADQAAFRRRAQAVDKERAIQENELQNQIELARREEQLIEQRGQNARREAAEKGEAARIDAEALALTTKLEAAASAEKIQAVDGVRLDLDRARLEAYRTMPPAVLAALALQEVAGKLTTIQHLNLTPDMLGSLLNGLVEAGTRKLGGGEGA